MEQVEIYNRVPNEIIIYSEEEITDSEDEDEDEEEEDEDEEEEEEEDSEEEEPKLVLEVVPEVVPEVVNNPLYTDYITELELEFGCESKMAVVNTYECIQYLDVLQEINGSEVPIDNPKNINKTISKTMPSGSIVHSKPVKFNSGHYRNSKITHILIDHPGVSQINKCMCINSRNLVSVCLDFKLVNLGQSSFKNCVSLRHVKLPETLKKIGKNTFQNCKSLIKFICPDSVEIIDSSSFMNCESLEYFRFPKSLKRINKYAFVKCNLQEINLGCFLNKNTINVEDSAFIFTNVNILILGSNVIFDTKYHSILDLSKVKLLMINKQISNKIIFHLTHYRTVHQSQFKYRCNNLLPIKLLYGSDNMVSNIHSGVFQNMTTMEEVSNIKLSVSIIDGNYCTFSSLIKYYNYNIYTSHQKLCIKTILLVSSHLYFYNKIKYMKQLLPYIPNEIWIMIISFIKRNELGLI